ncbi:MAG: sporulation initiation factor Spo0A C-terminal domain-containing protein [Clostridia bacterium]|nr:sporulation initiation factor Spo0A C-terminal domain-containing protein [Clostridia bacterium]
MAVDDGAFFIDGDSEEQTVRVKRMLKELGVRRDSKGFGILADAVVYSLRGDEVHGRLTKDIYPTVAKMRKQSEASVEKACRDSVRKCWQRGNREMFRDILGGAPRLFRGEPTVCEFLTAVRDYLDEAA